MAHASAKPTDYSGLQTDRYLGPVEVLAKVEDEEVFTEGPAVDPAGNVLFTNVPVSKIHKWDPRTRKLSVHRNHTNETNGLYFAPDGSLLACEGGAARVTRTDAATGKIEVLAEGFKGQPFAKPNDLCMDDKGRIYFTSRSAVDDPDGENVKAVYRIDPDGTVDQILAFPDVHMPNGIVTSPDNSKLYVIEAHPDADHHRDIRVYDLNDDGSVSNGRVLIDFYPGRSGDGMCIDAAGNLYVAAGLHKTRDTSETLDTKPGIHVVSPDGKLLAYRETPEDTITNCTFGGADLKSLYVACGTLLLCIPTRISGKPTYRPRA
ncbi:MAG: SMP-30/gluconolactonase/LRE family protein [Fuerstiella sp.]